MWKVDGLSGRYRNILGVIWRERLTEIQTNIVAKRQLIGWVESFRNNQTHIQRKSYEDTQRVTEK